MKKRFEKNTSFHSTIKTPVRLENPLNQDIWYCYDFNETHCVDGIEYVRVFKKDTPARLNLMRKSALNRVS